MQEESDTLSLGKTKFIQSSPYRSSGFAPEPKVKTEARQDEFETLMIRNYLPD